MLFGTALVVSACAGPRRPPETAGAGRLKDSVPEKVAAQRAASPGLDLENDDARWGEGAAQERKRQRDEKYDRRTKAANAPDIRATPAAAPLPLKY
ncbi:MAG: hypothetical protein JWM82_2314 [Myxococcales bacterium]|nr:hypothetical protein [Myxococcales bacterium]